jgi:hypothetical protein
MESKLFMALASANVARPIFFTVFNLARLSAPAFKVEIHFKSEKQSTNKPKPAEAACGFFVAHARVSSAGLRPKPQNEMAEVFASPIKALMSSSALSSLLLNAVESNNPYVALGTASNPPFSQALARFS